jgi:hypothetical protein
MPAAPAPTVHGEMHDRPYDDAVETLGAEFEALGREGGASPDRGEEAVALAGWGRFACRHSARCPRRC